MTKDRRIDRLYGGLTARERALFVLHAVKEDRETDRTTVWSIPEAQRATYSRLIGTINALNCELASVIFILHEQAEKVALKLAWLQTLHLWSGETCVLGALLLKHGKTLPARCAPGREEAPEAGAVVRPRAV